MGDESVLEPQSQEKQPRGLLRTPDAGDTSIKCKVRSENNNLVNAKIRDTTDTTEECTVGQLCIYIH